MSGLRITRFQITQRTTCLFLSSSTAASAKLNYWPFSTLYFSLNLCSLCFGFSRYSPLLIIPLTDSHLLKDAYPFIQRISICACCCKSSLAIEVPHSINSLPSCTYWLLILASKPSRNSSSLTSHPRMWTCSPLRHI